MHGNLAIAPDWFVQYVRFRFWSLLNFFYLKRGNLVMKSDLTLYFQFLLSLQQLTVA
jgi:hypothetical protein